jgi:hypothetical protein
MMSPPTATIDPYTGQTSITHGGYHVENKSIDVTITNQPSVNYYQIRFKGYFSTDWYTYSASIPNSMESTIYLKLSNGDYTVVSVPFSYWGENFPQGGQVDFQVRALIGQPSEQIMGQVRGLFFDGQTGDWSNTQTITIPSNTGSISTTPNPTTSYIPSSPPSTNSNGSTEITIQISSTNLLLLVGIVLVVVLAGVISIILSVRHRKTPKPSII